jgi:hypothetical protein
LGTELSHGDFQNRSVGTSSYTSANLSSATAKTAIGSENPPQLVEFALVSPLPFWRVDRRGVLSFHDAFGKIRKELLEARRGFRELEKFGRSQDHLKIAIVT